MKTDDIKINPQWAKSKDEIWDEVFADGEEEEVPQPGRTFSWVKYAVAAIVIGFVALGLYAYFYEITERAGRGSHRIVMLPGRTEVILNAESELSYKPYWWYVSRKAELKGEAFFDVQAGKRFTIQSGDNKTGVLGTVFNIYARNKHYRVTCLLGKVEVETKYEKLLLLPDMQVELQGDSLKVSDNIDAKQAIDWTSGRFSFQSVPLAEVIREIERQYDIHITADSALDHLYTGSFPKKKQAEEVLEIIGKPFGITFKIAP